MQQHLQILRAGIAEAANMPDLVSEDDDDSASLLVKTSRYQIDFFQWTRIFYV